MRTLVDIPERQITALANICANQRLSRAEAIRQAITCRRHRTALTLKALPDSLDDRDRHGQPACASLAYHIRG